MNRHAEKQIRIETDGVRRTRNYFLTICRAVYNEDHGCNTPIEEFIHTLILGLELRPLTLEDVRSDFEQLEEH